MMPLRRPERWKSQCSGAFGENLVTLLLIIVALWPRLHGGAGIMYAPVTTSTRVKAAITTSWSANSPPRRRWRPQRPSPQWSKPTNMSLRNPSLIDPPHATAWSPTMCSGTRALLTPHRPPSPRMTIGVSTKICRENSLITTWGHWFHRTTPLSPPVWSTATIRRLNRQVRAWTSHG